MATVKPYYRRRLPKRTFDKAELSDGPNVDFSRIDRPPFGASGAAAHTAARFDARAAAIMAAATGLGRIEDKDLLEPNPAPADIGEALFFGGRVLGQKCLAALALADYLPHDGRAKELRSRVSWAISHAGPGHSGTFGPGVDSFTDLLGDFAEGNYDMNQQKLLPIAYAFFDELDEHVQIDELIFKGRENARERVITELLAKGRIHRPNRPDISTSGPLPNDWRRAGFVSPAGVHRSIGETENHILMMLATRYLTNQLMFQRTHNPAYDNRRNGGRDYPSCLGLVLDMLRRIIRGDFSEYNAKGYQSETRWALLNLCSFAYDHEVRLGARMVLDYISAKMAVSSNDLRRMIPFRRRNEGFRSAHSVRGAMEVSLIIYGQGADPMLPYFAVQAGNLRACTLGAPDRDAAPVYGLPGTQEGLTLEILSDYRLPPCIHNLFVNDGHRRLFQRLHRTPWSDEIGGNRNADNQEIYAGSPSYLITAGGAPAGHAIPAEFAGVTLPGQDSQLGVAVTTSFMPTTGFDGSSKPLSHALELIQFGRFSQDPGAVRNYGVAPDFACGHAIPSFLPTWCKIKEQIGKFGFVDLGSTGSDTRSVRAALASREISPDRGIRTAMGAETSVHRWLSQIGRGPGFFLAIFIDDRGALLEALDTWLHPDVSYEQFRDGVLGRNGQLRLESDKPATYLTHNGTTIEFVVWGELGDDECGAEVRSVRYGSDANDALGDAGHDAGRLVNGTIMNSGPPGTVAVEIVNPSLGQGIVLDMTDPWKPRRTDENGHVESAGSHEEVWADFDESGVGEGDVCRPYTTTASAQEGVASYGTIRMIPSVSNDRTPLGVGKPFTMVAPIGGVVIG